MSKSTTTAISYGRMVGIDDPKIIEASLLK